MNFEPLRDVMQDLLKKGVPGLELMVCRDHEILFHECAGIASPADRYWMYSCTKPLTAATAMRAMEEGLFKLDDAVADYLPAYRNVYLLKDGQRVPVKNVMTIRHLMTMTAGLNYELDRESIRCVVRDTQNRATTVQIAEALAQDPLDFEPGERFQYSLCHDVLAAVIEKTSGMSFRDYMQEKILCPLGMSRTDFCTEGVPDHLASQYAFDEATREVCPCGPRNNFIFSSNYYSGGAGLVSCAEDMLKFADVMSCGGVNREGVRILSEESIDLMRTEQIHDFHVDGSFTCTCGADYGYGLGVRTRIAFNEGEPSSIGEFGWDGAAGADFLMDPEHRLSMFYAQHVLSWPALEGIVHLQLRDALYPIFRNSFAI